MKLNDNAYVLDLPSDGSYNVHGTFNICNLVPFESDIEEVNLRSNSSKVGGNDVDISQASPSTHQENRVAEPLSPFHELGGPMTRARSKKMQEHLQAFMRVMAQDGGKEWEKCREEQLHQFGVQIKECTLAPESSTTHPGTSPTHPMHNLKSLNKAAPDLKSSQAFLSLPSNRGA